jgi:hypothetical protein
MKKDLLIPHHNPDITKFELALPFKVPCFGHEALFVVVI